MDRKYKICFEDETVQRSYKNLLQHTCPICNEKLINDNAGAGNEKGNIKIPTVFSSFKQLDTHVRREHEMFYCDLCADNLKVREKYLVRGYKPKRKMPAKCISNDFKYFTSL